MSILLIEHHALEGVGRLGEILFRVFGSKITMRTAFEKSATMTCLSRVGNASDG